ncbi:MAG: VTT domain-containing protein [Kangiellaceae bacterium]|nr:VTT domain-containing protein [Kangiellaceae bacterium]
MHPLLKMFLILASFFGSTFLVVKSMGVLSIEQIEEWLINARNISPLYVAILIAGLLLADLFIAVPTLTVSLLSGYILGFQLGAIAALTGTMCAGIFGYLLSAHFGQKFFGYVVKDENQRKIAIDRFEKNGFLIILLSRALPILPESCACIAGVSKMKFRRFILAWSLSTVPYVLIASYAGSQSSLENPKPAIYAAIFISSLLWVGWLLFNRKSRH